MELREWPTNYDVVVEGFNKEQHYPMMKRRSLREWWKNHSLPQRGEERANVAILEAPLSLNEAIRHNMQKLMGDIRTSLHNIDKLKN